MSIGTPASIDTELSIEGNTRLKFCIHGVDPKTGTTDASDYRLSIYAFDSEEFIKPVFDTTLSLEEASRLYNFVGAVSLVRESGKMESGRLIELPSSGTDGLLEEVLKHPRLLAEPMLIRRVLDSDPQLVKAIIQTEFKATEIVALAYRSEQLGVFKQLLEDDSFFSRYSEENAEGKPEGAWQFFFEKNPWIFGLGLDYAFGDSALSDKLEQTVSGASINASGKRIDALLRTRGLIRSLCYVEIKRHDTKLMNETAYRPDIFRASKELSGGVAQVQGTIQRAIENLGPQFRPTSGNAEDALLFNLQPRCVLVCGSLSEFFCDDRIDSSRFGSYELFRRNLVTPEVLTFDEVYDRAAAVVQASPGG